jgi:hypothetical protein
MPAIMGDGRKKQAGRAVGVGFVHGQEKLRRFVKPSIPAAKVEPPFTIWRLPSLAAGREARSLLGLLRRKPDCLLSSPISNVLQLLPNLGLLDPFRSFGKAIGSQHGFDHQRVMPTSG